MQWRLYWLCSRWQTQLVPCQQESAWSRACQLCDRNPGRQSLPHIRGTSGFFGPAAPRQLAVDSAAGNSRSRHVIVFQRRGGDISLWMRDTHLPRQPPLDLSNLSLPVSLIFGWNTERKGTSISRVIYRMARLMWTQRNQKNLKIIWTGFHVYSNLSLFFLLLTEQKEKPKFHILMQLIFHPDTTSITI